MEQNDYKRKDLKSTPSQEKKIKYDKGEVTYGHIISNPIFSRKDKADENSESEENIDVNEQLNNINLTKDTDISNRNQNKEKGVRGKDL
ncbi:hypothetical protein [Pedobacter punctiformis]|uniref:Uncharacterized protein n=1 Tax=Pedobacter punctiformis TaxID=3004097 RepID=A0ABT4L3T6_9SPHI|nr:hypothetical protein [Pedobacter sp. HCMS5-2]MCZ4242584.1 hypothetical protein [Pedobacter sp. HCMS5-2]